MHPFSWQCSCCQKLNSNLLIRPDYQSKNTTPPVLSELLKSAAYYNTSATSGVLMRKKAVAGRSAEVTHKEMEDSLRAMTDVIKAKDEQMRAKDEAMLAKDERMAEAMRAKDVQIAEAMNSLSNLKATMRDEIRQEMASTLEAKDQEIEKLRQTQPRPISSTQTGPMIVDTAIYGTQ